MKKLLSTLSLLALVSTLALADEKPARPAGGPEGPGKGDRPSPEEVFKKMDTDGDGKLSLEEFKAGHHPRPGGPGGPGGPGKDGARKGGPKKDGAGKGGEKPAAAQ